MLRRLTLFPLALLALAGLASAEEASLQESLRAMIQERIEMAIQSEADQAQEINAGAAVGAPDCSQGQALFCPLANPPSVVFGPESGVFQSTVSPCCPRNYLQCQIQQSQQYCRLLGTYTINPQEGSNQEVCPPTTPDCSECFDVANP